MKQLIYGRYRNQDDCGTWQRDDYRCQTCGRSLTDSHGCNGDGVHTDRVQSYWHEREALAAAFASLSITDMLELKEKILEMAGASIENEEVPEPVTESEA